MDIHLSLSSEQKALYIQFQAHFNSIIPLEFLENTDFCSLILHYGIKLNCHYLVAFDYAKKHQEIKLQNSFLPDDIIFRLII